MLNQITYRFLGVVVLVGLLFIIVPMLFDNVVRYQTVRPASPPAMPAVVIQQPQPPTITAVPVDANLPSLTAYTVQIASFKRAEDSRHLVLLFQQDGFTAYSRSSTKTGLTTIFVGPVLTKEQANTLVGQLQKKYTQLKPVIIAYTPQE